MRIVLGVDDSAHSQAAVRMVKEMSWPPGTRCLVLAAAPPQAVAHSLLDAGGVTFLKSVEQSMTRQAEELTARVERELREAGLGTEARVTTADPRGAIVDAARESGADVVVVGSHGRTGVGRLLMGSVANHVIDHAPCSVLVVKLRR